MAIRYLSGINVDSNTLFVDSTNNRVGIGTASPGVKLQVDGTIWAKPTSNGALGTALRLGVFTDSASTAAYEFKTNDSTDDFLGLYSNRWGINYEIHRDSATGDKYVWAVYGDDSGHTMQLYNGSNTNSVRLSSFSSSWLNGGNVGIGTTSPNEKLHVFGTIEVSGFQSIGNGPLTMLKSSYNGGPGVQVKLLTYNPNNGFDSDFAIEVMNSSGVLNEAIRVVGNTTYVGIGNSAPSQKLHVTGNVRVTGAYYDSSNSAGTSGQVLTSTGSGTAWAASTGGISGSGTTNYVSKWTSGSAIGNSIIYDNGTNVGIGTASPTGELHIYGSQPAFRIQSSVSGNMQFGQWDTTTNRIQSTGRNFYLVGTDAYDTIFATNGSERMRITSAGNVGIGTTSPSQKLQVAGSVALNTVTDGTSRYYTYPDANHSWYYDDNIVGSSADVMTYYENFLVRHQDTTNVFLINGSGNVGIGTTSPSQKLDVAGQARFGSGAKAIVGTDGTYGGYSTIGFGGTTNGYNRVFGYDGTGDGLYLTAATGQGISLWTNGTNSSMFIAAAGNVGIGTNSPAAKLQVVGETRSTSFTNVGPLGTGSNNARNHFTQLGAGTASPATGWIAAAFGDASAARIVIGQWTNGVQQAIFGAHTANLDGWADTNYVSINHKFYVNGDWASAPSVTFTSTGLVGIGTTSPGAKLNVAGNLGATVGAGGSAIRLTNTDTGNYASIGAGIVGINNAGMQLSVDGASRMIIDAAGNVLIGTLTTYTRLTVSNGTSTRSGITISDTNTASLMMIAGASAPASISFDSFGLRFVGGSTVGTDNGSEFMRITTAGNIGIGTTSPGAKLDVNGYIASERYYPYNANSTYIYGDTGGLSIGGGGYMYVNTPSGSYFQNIARFRGGISNDSGPYLHVYGGWSGITYFDGTIGVGTTTPSQKLHVVGNVRVTGAYYDSNNEPGTGGQVLTSTASGTDWVTPYTSVATSLYDLLPAARVAYNWTGQVVNDTWVDIFSAANNILTTGTWMVQMYISDWAQGGQHYTYTYTGTMQWYQETVNQGGEPAASEIYLHRMGHAANASALYLRTTEMTAVSGGIGKLQVKANYSNTSNTTINFKFVKIF